MSATRHFCAMTSLVVMLLQTVTAYTDDREIVRQINLPDGNLSKQFHVNEKSGRHYANYVWKAEKGQRIELHVYSSDHEPEILIFATDSEGKLAGQHLAKSKPEKPYPHPETKRLVYYSSIAFNSTVDATYKAIITHAGEKKPGEWRLEGTVYSKLKGAELRPTITGYEIKPWGDPEKPVRKNGTKSIGAYHNAGREAALSTYADWVPAGSTPESNWDSFAKLGGGIDLYRKNVLKEEEKNDMIIRSMKSGGKDIVLISRTKKTFVVLNIYAKYISEESKFIEAGKRQLAALEELAVDR